MSPTRLSRLESAMRIVLAFNEAFNRHDVLGMMKLMSSNCIFEPATDSSVYAGKEAITLYWKEYFQQSPQANIEIEEIFGMSRRCIMRWKCEWMDDAGKTKNIRGADVFKVEEELITEKFSYVKGKQR